ncbi:HAD family phosphatase [Erysipelothrix sp. HDW6C]|uniref:Cof-type HAD-IIB family hydrolase n=1 Tax=Erysipelothrix sp. HDW6C TaxID=2714930 RepID=UPI001408C76C|nr:HAD family hydrolase [Erysipelothrix sp. HDW6C]QIK69087.1 HAD family phosphatase [Erysipelothrix sp. HDW6C]
MIKLIATDMDHTLLDNDSKLPDNFGLVLTKLEEKGIQLVLASGRTLFSIKNKAHDYVDRLAFISDNGAIVENKGTVDYISEISDANIQFILDACRSCTEASIIASSIDRAYVELREESHREPLHEYYLDYTIVDDISKIDDVIVKITMMSQHNTVDNYHNTIEPLLSNQFNAVMAGKVWIDVMNTGIDKGIGLKHLIDSLGIHEDEVMSFGDYHNDIGMLTLATHSFAVSNAHDDVKAVVSKVIGSNQDNSVMNQILETIE